MTLKTLTVIQETAVSALATVPPATSAYVVFAHGAGAGMKHPAIAGICTVLAARRIATLRYQFPYIEQGDWDISNSSGRTSKVRWQLHL